MQGFGVSLLISFVIMLFSHLSRDRDFPDTLKTGAYVVLGVLALLYIIFGIF